MARAKSKSTALALTTTPSGRPSRDQSKALATLPAVAAAIDQLEPTLGGRDTLIKILSGAPLTEDLAFVLNCIADPRQDTRKLSTICKTMGISLFEVYEALKQGIFASATIQSMAIVAKATPPVVEDIMARAVPHQIDCEACHGIGTVTSVAKPDAPPTPCLPCRATGKVLVIPDVERQKLALSISPLAPKGGPLVNVDQRSVTIQDHSPEGFAKLLAATDRILHSRRDRAPATVVTVMEEDEVSDGA